SLLTGDPLDPFAKSLKHRLVLFPWLSPPSTAALDALLTAANAVGDTWFYADVDGEVRRVPPAQRGTLEGQTGDSVAFLSPSCEWAIVTSDFDDAIVAAVSRTFIDVLMSALPTREDDWQPYVVSRGDEVRGKRRWE